MVVIEGGLFVWTIAPWVRWCRCLIAHEGESVVNLQPITMLLQTGIYISPRCLELLYFLHPHLLSYLVSCPSSILLVLSAATMSRTAGHFYSREAAYSLQRHMQATPESPATPDRILSTNDSSMTWQQQEAFGATVSSFNNLRHCPALLYFTVRSTCSLEPYSASTHRFSLSAIHRKILPSLHDLEAQNPQSERQDLDST